MRTQKMKRTNYFFPEPMLDQLRDLSQKTGFPVSELVRKAIAKYLEKQNEKRDDSGEVKTISGI